MSTVTVGIPTILGREEKLSVALDSVEQQVRQPDHVLVEKDAFRTGAAPTRNRIINKTETEYIAWLDDDDRLLSNHLSVLMKESEKYPKADVIYPTPKILNMHDPTAVSVNGKWVPPWGHPFTEESKHHLIWRGNFIPMTHLVKTQALQDIGGFPIPGSAEWRPKNCEDWGMLRKLAKAGKVFHHVNEVTWVWEWMLGEHTGGQADR